MTIPAVVQKRKNQLNAGTWFERVDLTCRDGTVFNFCNSNENVTVAGTDYTAVPFVLSDLDQVSQGAIPSRRIEVGNVDVSQFLIPYVKNKDGLRGSTMVITRVLYDEPNADMTDLSQTYTVLSCEPSDTTLTIHLGGTNLMRQNIPLERYRNTLCRWAKDFKGVGCGYTGLVDSCDGTFATCRSLSNDARFGAEIGLRPKVVKWT